MLRRILTPLALALALAPSIARGRDEPANKAIVPVSPSASPAPGASSARPLKPEEEAAPLPAGHPMVAPEEDEDGETPPPGAGSGTSPHAGVPSMFQPPPDTSEEDATLPPGTFVVDVRDADNKPVPNANLVLTVLHQSVAQGQKKDNLPEKADGNGQLRLDHLETGSAVSYWVKDLVGPATFASQPTQLGGVRGVHAVMHVYPVAESLETAVIVVQGVIYFEVKDDRVQVEEALTFFNFGKTAWVPKDFVVKLPPGFTALTSQAQMSDQGIDSVEKVGARIRGTYAPGRHDLDFRWQLPYDGERDLSVDVNLPPHVAIMRVMAAAGRDTKLEVEGFPEAQRRTDRQGQKVLITEKQVRRDEPLSHVQVAIRGLLVPSPARYVATGVAIVAVLAGLYLSFEKREKGKGGAKAERAELLREILELERARRRGDVGPKTYERARREIIDAIAETLDATT